MLKEILIGFGWIIGYYAAFIAAGLLMRRFVPMHSELFRKSLHLIALCSVFILTYGPMSWQSAAVVSAIFIAAIFPALTLAERIPSFSQFMTERKKGELKMSMILMFTVFALLICICWGWLERKYLVIASVMAWGVGDAAAALVGKKFGRHFISGRLVEGRKSLEGTFAMFITSFIAVLITLLVNKALVWYVCIPVSALTAAVCALVELYTLNGMDTITCPLAAAAILIPLMYL